MHFVQIMPVMISISFKFVFQFYIKTTGQIGEYKYSWWAFQGFIEPC